MAELERVPLVMFKDGYDLREATIEACRRAGFAPVLAMSGLEMDGALALAAAGVAAAVVPESVVPPRGPLRAVRFRDGALRRTVGLASRTGPSSLPCCAGVRGGPGRAPGGARYPRDNPSASSGAHGRTQEARVGLGDVVVVPPHHDVADASRCRSVAVQNHGRVST